MSAVTAFTGAKMGRLLGGTDSARHNVDRLPDRMDFSESGGSQSSPVSCVRRTWIFLPPLAYRDFV